MAMATKIFINYRRGDVRSDAARIRDRLATVFGPKNVFMDVENLVAGQRFDMALAKSLASSPFPGESEPIHISFGFIF